MIWKQTANPPTKPVKKETDLTVVFHAEGGIDRNGSFTEGSERTEYVKLDDLILELMCDNLSFVRSWGFQEDRSIDDGFCQTSSEGFEGRGTIRPATQGNYSLSFLGSHRKHSKLEIIILKGKEMYIRLVPFRATRGNRAGNEQFVLEILLDEKFFDELRDELRANPDFQIRLSVDLSGVQGLYAKWSPKRSEGRVLKVLDRREDVANHFEMSEEFGPIGLDGNRLPFTISVGQFKDADIDHPDMAKE